MSYDIKINTLYSFFFSDATTNINQCLFNLLKFKNVIFKKNFILYNIIYNYYHKQKKTIFLIFYILI